MSENILDTRIEDLKLTTRSYSCLKRGGYYTVGKLVEATANELLMLSQFGKGSLDEIVQKLDSLGLSLKQESAPSDNKPEFTNMTKIYEEMQVEMWVDTEDVAEHLGISLRTVHALIKAGKLPAHKKREKYRFKISEVEAWLRAGKLAED